MADIPWDIIIGIGIVLLGTGAFVAWILMLDNIEYGNATEKGLRQEDRQPKHQEIDQ